MSLLLLFEAAFFLARGGQLYPFQYLLFSEHECHLRVAHCKAKVNRTIEFSYNIKRLKQLADELLLREEGIRHQKQRPCDIEQVFGNIKNDHYFNALNCLVELSCSGSIIISFCENDHQNNTADDKESRYQLGLCGINT